MKKFYFVSILLSFGSLMFSQNSNTKAVKSKENLLEAEMMTGQSSAMAMKTTPSNSNYFGMDNDISALMVDNKIPDTFPKQQPNQSKEDYINIINKWIENNSTFLNKESKNFKFNISK